MRRFILPAVLLGSVALTSVWFLQRSSEQTEARLLSQSLLRHQYYYQNAIERQSAVVSMALHAIDTGAALESVGEDAVGVASQLEDLHQRLRVLPVSGSVRERMLDPVLRQLMQEKAELLELQRRMSGDRTELRRHLLEHGSPADLLGPALQQIADQYGLPRPKLWRGRPLVS
jgi:hypothetical protein